MTTSWTQTRNQIITRALRQIGAVSFGETPSADAIANGSDALNSLAQSLQNEGIMLWSSDWTTQTLTASNVVLGSDSLNYTCIRSHTSATANKPITGANYTTYWKQTGSSGATWATSTAYTSINQFTLASSIIDIETPFVRYNGNTDIPIEIIDREHYFSLVDKTITGNVPSKMWIDYALNALEVYLYPQPSDSTVVIHFKKITRLEDFTVSGTIDFPVRWIKALTHGLAYELAPEYRIPVDEREEFRRDYLEAKNIAKMNNMEKPDYSFVKGAF